MQVSIRDFKAHLSRYLAEARAGAAIDLTAHRKVVARVVGVPPAETEGVARLLASGAGQWSGGKPAGAEIRLTAAGRGVSEMVLEDRG
jgi:antitoxin (DNA-binding transcriptional repressor) of toxin-antitoxin stability system